MLALERRECACIFAGDAAGEIIDFRAETAPMAALAVRLTTVATQPSRGSSPMHVIDVIGPRRETTRGPPASRAARRTRGVPSFLPPPSALSRQCGFDRLLADETPTTRPPLPGGAVIT